MRLIDADVLMDELENDRPLNWTDSPGEIQEQNDWDRFMGMVSVANTIDAVPVVRGKWKSVGLAALKCSKCGYVDDWKMYYNYCPNCGATMDGE